MSNYPAFLLDSDYESDDYNHGGSCCKSKCCSTTDSPCVADSQGAVSYNTITYSMQPDDYGPAIQNPIELASTEEEFLDVALEIWNDSDYGALLQPINYEVKEGYEELVTIRQFSGREDQLPTDIDDWGPPITIENAGENGYGQSFLFQNPDTDGNTEVIATLISLRQSRIGDPSCVDTSWVCLVQPWLDPNECISKARLGGSFENNIVWTTTRFTTFEEEPERIDRGDNKRYSPAHCQFAIEDLSDYCEDKTYEVYWEFDTVNGETIETVQQVQSIDDADRVGTDNDVLAPVVYEPGVTNVKMSPEGINPLGNRGPGDYRTKRRQYFVVNVQGPSELDLVLDLYVEFTMVINAGEIDEETQKVYARLRNNFDRNNMIPPFYRLPQDPCVNANLPFDQVANFHQLTPAQTLKRPLREGLGWGVTTATTANYDFTDLNNTFVSIGTDHLRLFRGLGNGNNRPQIRFPTFNNPGTTDQNTLTFKGMRWSEGPPGSLMSQSQIKRCPRDQVPAIGGTMPDVPQANHSLNGNDVNFVHTFASDVPTGLYFFDADITTPDRGAGGFRHTKLNDVESNVLNWAKPVFTDMTNAVIGKKAIYQFIGGYTVQDDPTPLRVYNAPGPDDPIDNVPLPADYNTAKLEITDANVGDSEIRVRLKLNKYVSPMAGRDLCLVVSGQFKIRYDQNPKGKIYNVNAAVPYTLIQLPRDVFDADPQFDEAEITFLVYKAAIPAGQLFSQDGTIHGVLHYSYR